MTNLLYIEKVKVNRKEFAEKVITISKALGINPNWLMAAMNFESAGTFDPAIVNKRSGATGLIQFMPSTAKGLGTTVEALRLMSNVKQLDYVYKYFKPYASKLKRYIDLYLTIFFPVAVGMPGSFIIQAKKLTAEQIAKANPIFDLNRDGQLTVSEVEQVILGRDSDAVKKKLL